MFYKKGKVIYKSTLIDVVEIALRGFVNLEAGQTDPCKLEPNMELGFSHIVVNPLFVRT